MKKFLTGVLALALALGLSACGGENDSGSAPYGAGDVETVVNAGAFSEELEELDGDTAFVLYRFSDYGLSREDLKECAVQRSAGATCEEGAVLVFADADKAKTAADALKAYIQNQIDANEDYRPAEIPKLEGAMVDQREESLLLVVANDLEAAKDALK